MEQIKDEMELNSMSPLTWAYIGDCVYELHVRTYLVKTTKLKPHMLHIQTIKYVSASAQARILEGLKEYLTEDEQEIVRRARNTENHHLPKNANVMEYRQATALEGLIGFLYLNGNEERYKYILDKCIEIGKENA